MSFPNGSDSMASSYEIIENVYHNNIDPNSLIMQSAFEGALLEDIRVKRLANLSNSTKQLRQLRRNETWYWLATYLFCLKQMFLYDSRITVMYKTGYNSNNKGSIGITGSDKQQYLQIKHKNTAKWTWQACYDMEISRFKFTHYNYFRDRATKSTLTRLVPNKHLGCSGDFFCSFVVAVVAAVQHLNASVHPYFLQWAALPRLAWPYKIIIVFRFTAVRESYNSLFCFEKYKPVRSQHHAPSLLWSGSLLSQLFIIMPKQLAQPFIVRRVIKQTYFSERAT